MCPVLWIIIWESYLTVFCLTDSRCWRNSWLLNVFLNTISSCMPTVRVYRHCRRKICIHSSSVLFDVLERSGVPVVYVYGCLHVCVCLLPSVWVCVGNMYYGPWIWEWYSSVFSPVYAHTVAALTFERIMFVIEWSWRWVTSESYADITFTCRTPYLIWTFF